MKESSFKCNYHSASVVFHRKLVIMECGVQFAGKQSMGYSEPAGFIYNQYHNAYR